MSRGQYTEAALAAWLVQWLRDQLCDVYQEVQVRGSRADIVALHGPVVHVIEVKTAMSWALLEQAIYWQHLANRVSVAVPFPGRHVRGRHSLRQFLKYKGIGLYYIGHRIISQELPGQLYRKVRVDRIRNSLCEEQKTYAPAGNAENQYYSPFKRTTDRLRAFLQENPGAVIKEIVDSVGHHYASDASAKSALSHWVRNDKVPGVISRRDGRFVRYYLKDEGDNDQG